jgi:hypothetical protein
MKTTYRRLKSRDGKFKTRSSGLWRRAVLWWDTNVSDVHAVSRVKMEAAWTSETLLSYNIKDVTIKKNTT